MRKLLTPDEVRALADTAPEAEPYWIANDIQRGEHFRKVLSECDRCELIRLLKSLHTRRQELSGCGRHLRTADQNIMKRAEKIVREEVSLVMHIDPDDVMPYLFEGRSASSLPTAH
jgi:CarD family transcriptional regulator